MIKKIAIIIVLSICSTSFANASPPDSTLNVIKKAEVKLLISDGKKYYAADNYKLALVKFREALIISKKSAEANYWISECHLELTNFDISLKYAKIAESIDPSISKELYYVIGQSQHRLGDLDNAIENYHYAIEKMSKADVKDFQIRQKIEECERAKDMMKNGKDIKIEALGININSKYDEYSPVLTNNGKTLYFSARKAENEGGGYSSGDNKYFSDIFVSHWDESEKEWTKASNNKLSLDKINTLGFDDVAFITHDGQKLYYGINTEGILDAKINTQSTDIYVSTLKDGEWTNPKPIDKKAINSIYFEASPSFTKDGNTMYFISERIGGRGKADIWVSRLENKRWSKPENVGDKINTAQQETTVSVTPDGKYLFYSSQGHEGMGGYDVYVSRNENGVWSDPKNLGYPINDVSDETHFAYYPQFNKAYYSKASSKKNKGIGRRDIFEIDLTNFDLEELFSTP